jgi:hypothetical protein
VSPCRVRPRGGLSAERCAARSAARLTTISSKIDSRWQVWVPKGVHCPLDCRPGSSFSYQAPDGRQQTLVVPPGVAPGRKFQVQLPLLVCQLRCVSVESVSHPPVHRLRFSGSLTGRLGGRAGEGGLAGCDRASVCADRHACSRR